MLCSMLEGGHGHAKPWPIMSMLGTAGPIFIRHLRQKTKKSDISLSLPIFFSYYLKTFYVDLYTVVFATYHNNNNLNCFMVLL